jgi:general nucleoside transport system permease protein
MTDASTRAPLTAPILPPAVPAWRADLDTRIRASAEQIVIPVGAVLIALLIFSAFLMLLGKSPADFFSLIWRGGFGTAFSWQNTLQRAAPLVLTALCVALPARTGLVIIGGEGALVLGGFVAAAIAIPIAGAWSPWLVMPLMILGSVLTGAVWIGIAGWLRHSRGVNETISSLLLTYIAIAIMNFFVEGMLRDPGSPNKPSTKAIGEANMIGKMPGLDVHWGLAVGAVLCILLFILLNRTTFGFAARVTGGNVRAARAQGLPVGWLIVTTCMIAGGCAGLAGYFEVAAVHGKVNGSIAAGYGFTGILVSFLARHNPLAIMVVAVLFGGIAAAGGLIQRRMDMPDATVLVLQGVIFLVILLSETLYGRLTVFKSKAEAQRA